jgi:hypothetical protein
MIFPRHLFLLLLAAILSGATTLHAANVSAQKLEQTRTRIEALYRHRLQPPPAPDAKSNPFRVGEAAPTPTSVARPATGDAPAAEPVPAEGDAALLKRAAETLIVGGRAEIAGRVIAVINKANYQEGDSLTVRLPGVAPVVLRVRRITTTQVTLALNEAETSLRIQPGAGR